MYPSASSAPVYPSYDMSQEKQPYQLAFSTEEFRHFFLKGAKWWVTAVLSLLAWVLVIDTEYLL